MNEILATRPRRWWLCVTLLLGALMGPVVASGTPAGARTFAAVSTPVQLVMSITLAFLGVLLAAGAPDRGRPARPAPVRAALGLAGSVALFGSAVSAASVAVAGSAASGGPWRHAPGGVLGGLVVQAVALLFGIGFGWLIGRPFLACLATFAPLGVWVLMGAVEALRPVRAWVLPSENASALLAGDAPGAYLRELVVVVVWTASAAALRRGRLVRG